MLERSRYGRPVTADDVATLAVLVGAVQQSVLAWMDQPSVSAGEGLAGSAAELCAAVNELSQDCLAPSASGLYIVR